MAIFNFLSELKPSFSWAKTQVNWRGEVTAGFVGAILVIPQAITFAYLAGLPASHGIYCAVFVAFFTAIFGNSTLVGGPNTAVSIMIGTTVAASAPHRVADVFFLTFLVGAIQLLFWLARAAKVFELLTPITIKAISTGVGLLIINAALGNLLHTSFADYKSIASKAIWLFEGQWHHIDTATTMIGFLCVAVGLGTRPYLRRSYILLTMATGLLLGVWQRFLPMEALQNVQFMTHLEIALLPFDFNWLSLADRTQTIPYFTSAIAIATMGLAQSLLIATELKHNQDSRINLNKEVLAQGIANLLAPFFSAFAGSGSFNRTQVNTQLHARTPASIIFASLIVLFLMSTLGSVITLTPLTTISAVLIIVGVGMIQPANIRRLMQDWFDVLSFFVVWSCVLLLGLKIALVMAFLLSFAHLGRQRFAEKANA